MEKTEFEQIQSQLEKYQFSSLTYAEYEEVETYKIICKTPELILILGYNPEAKQQEYHWAANNPQELIKKLTEQDCFVTFIPHEWVKKMETAGFKIRNAWHDYFMESLENVKESKTKYPFLQQNECEEAAEVTVACRGDSRGFTGQTKEWFQEWIGEKEGFAQNRVVLTERNEKGKIIGLVCAGTYGNAGGTGEIAWIREVGVRPEYRNQGIARKLITQALWYGKCHGAVKAFLAADEQNYRAIHLYESIGFKASVEESQIDMIKSNVK